MPFSIYEGGLVNCYHLAVNEDAQGLGFALYHCSNMKWWLVLYCCLGYVLHVHAQTPVFRWINNTNGLPTNAIYYLHQDKRGFIWIAHDRGLTRYDGKKFKHFNNVSQRGRSLTNIMETGDSVIWCQDFAGNFFYVQNDSLMLEQRIVSNGMYAPASIFNERYLVHPNASHIYYFDTKKHQPLYRKSIGANVFHASYGANTGYAIGALEIIEFDLKGFKRSIRKHPKPSSDKESVFFVKEIGSRIVGFYKSWSPHVALIDGPTEGLQVPDLPSSAFIKEVFITKADVWICTSSGVYWYDTLLRPKTKGPILVDFAVSNVTQDREGNFWISSTDKGIAFVPNLSLTLSPVETVGITAFSNIERNNTLKIGTSRNQVYTFNTLTNEIQPYVTIPYNHEVIDLYEIPNTNYLLVGNNAIHLYDGKQPVWSLANSGKSFTYVKDNMFIAAVTTGSIALNINRTIKQRPIWLGPPTPDDPSMLKLNYLTVRSVNARGRYVYYDTASKFLWIATSNGLGCIDSVGRFQDLKYPNGSEVYASQILPYKNGITIVGTFATGVSLWQNNKVIKTYRQENNQLANNTIYKMDIDGDVLWLVSDYAVQALNLVTDELRVYSKADGLPQVEIKDIKCSNGKVFLATSLGIVSFPTNMPSKNERKPIIALLSVRYNNKKLLEGKNGIYHLLHKQNEVDIEYGLLAYKTGDEIKVQYRINGGRWIDHNSDTRSLHLASLLPGSYEVDIIAINEDSMVATPLTVNIKVAYPFWLQWWFILLVLLAVIGLVRSYLRNRVKEIEQKNALEAQKLQLEQELQKSMLAAIKSQMNPHFLFNALNTIQSYIYTNDKENASQYLGRFSELTRMILDMSNRENIPLSDEIKALKLYLSLEKIRFDESLVYDITIAKDISIELIHIPSMLIQPYVENAIKHGLLHKRGAKKVTVAFELRENGIQVTIDDNGIGRERSLQLNALKRKRHNSFATSANEKRLEILNRGLGSNAISLHYTDKYDEHGNASGTTVTIHIPFITVRQPAS